MVVIFKLKAAVLRRGCQFLSVEELPMPELSQETAVVRVKAAGVCRTDLHFLEGIEPVVKDPFVLGHEIAGTVEESPPGSTFQRGDRVVVYTFVSCGKCTYCLRQMENLCSKRQQIGFTLDGGFAEYVKVPLRCLVRLPDGLNFQEAAVLGCSGMSAVHSVRLAGIKPDEIVVVNGVGGLGALVVQLARMFGAKVIGIIDDSKRRPFVEKLGADDVLIASAEDIEDRIEQASGGRGVDAWFELVGTRSSVQIGLESLGRSGRFIAIGYCSESWEVIPIPLITGEHRLLGSVGGTKRDLEEAISLANERKIQVHIDNVFSLEEINTPFDLLRQRKTVGRNVICP